MQYSQEHLKTMVYAKFGGQTECIMGNSKIENWSHWYNKVSDLPTLSHANLENLECLNKSSQKPGDWHLKSGVFSGTQRLFSVE